MNKIIFTLALFALSLSATAQNTFRIDFLSDSSFYLVQIVQRQPTADNPATSVEYPQKFNDRAQLRFYINALRKQAADTKAAAEKALEDVPRTLQVADKIDDLEKAIDKKVVVVKPEPSPTKPIPKPKKKSTKN